MTRYAKSWMNMTPWAPSDYAYAI